MHHRKVSSVEIEVPSCTCPQVLCSQETNDWKAARGEDWETDEIVLGCNQILQCPRKVWGNQITPRRRDPSQRGAGEKKRHIDQAVPHQRQIQLAQEVVHESCWCQISCSLSVEGKHIVLETHYGQDEAALNRTSSPQPLYCIHKMERRLWP